jgi:hypothetical protein
MLRLQLESGEVARHVFVNRIGIQNVGAGMRVKYSLLQMGFLSILYTTTPIPSISGSTKLLSTSARIYNPLLFAEIFQEHDDDECDWIDQTSPKFFILSQ